MTHDSIGLGEDGPTHQPIEHLQSLRAMPDLDVYRTCDIIETADCWHLALDRADGPSLLALTRQNLPQFRDGRDVLSPRRACPLRGYKPALQVVPIATITDRRRVGETWISTDKSRGSATK